MKTEGNRKSGAVEKLSSLMEVHHILHIVKDLMFALVKIIAAIFKDTIDMMLPCPEKSLCGQVVLITGAGSVIGRELAFQFANHGCRVACVDTDTASNKETTSQVNHRFSMEDDSSSGYLPIAVAYTCDVYNQRAVMNTARRVEQDLGRIDILVNNAVMPEQPQTDRHVVDLVNRNMISNYWMVLAVVPGMIQRKQGHIVAVSTMTDISSCVDKPPCSSAQYAVAGLMDSINEELRLEENNIRITCVHPCVIMIKPNMMDTSHMRIHELSPEFAASEMITAIKQNKTSLTIPKDLSFWINVFRTMPQDSRNIWQNVFIPHGHMSHSHLTGRLQHT